jgi:hypothetical protein
MLMIPSRWVFGLVSLSSDVSALCEYVGLVELTNEREVQGHRKDTRFHMSSNGKKSFLLGIAIGVILVERFRD